MSLHTWVVTLLLAVTLTGQEQRPAVPALLSRDAEQFLLSASITTRRELSTGTIRLRLDDGKRTHDALADFVDKHPPGEDIKLNIAAYELDKALELDLVTPAVERVVNGKPAIVSWWVEDLAMTELDRRRGKIEPPDADRWTKQMQAVRVFDELIANSYRNIDPSFYLTTLWDNLLITKDWSVWVSDHKRAFRFTPQLEHPESLTHCDRVMLGKLRALDKSGLQRMLERYLSPQQLDALDARRQLLVKHFDDEIARKGEGEVLYELRR